MEGVIGIAAFVAIVAVIVLIRKGLNRGVAKVSGAVTGNTRKRGLATVALRTHFEVPVDSMSLFERVAATLQLGERAAQGLKLGGYSDDRDTMSIVQGNRLATVLLFGISTERTANGCTGMAAAAEWMESGGQIVATENIERIHRHVASAVEHFGGTWKTEEA